MTKMLPHDSVNTELPAYIYRYLFPTVFGNRNLQVVKTYKNTKAGILKEY